MSCEFLSSLARGFYQGLRLRVEHKADSWRGNKLDVLADFRDALSALRCRERRSATSLPIYYYFAVRP
jgi:hypothetical protein